MVKYYTDGTVVPKDQENFVRVKRNTSLVQAGTSDQQILYEQLSDVEVIRTFLEFGDLK